MVVEPSRNGRNLSALLIEAWLAVTLILFFVLRVLDSHAGQHALSVLRHGR